MFFKQNTATNTTQNSNSVVLKVRVSHQMCDSEFRCDCSLSLSRRLSISSGSERIYTIYVAKYPSNKNYVSRPFIYWKVIALNHISSALQQHHQIVRILLSGKKWNPPNIQGKMISFSSGNRQPTTSNIFFLLVFDFYIHSTSSTNKQQHRQTDILIPIPIASSYRYTPRVASQSHIHPVQYVSHLVSEKLSKRMHFSF